jgi:hypothetical protein
MNLVSIKDNVVRGCSTVTNKLQKHSPEILIVAGVVGAVTSTIMACKATLKVNDILTKSNETVTKIKETANSDEYKDVYSEEDKKKDLTICYLQTSFKLAKLYAPAVGLGALSLGAILTSNNILRKRNVALAAAYATVDQGFKQYRGNVIERFGEKVDYELQHNLKAKEIVETTTDENGNEKTEKKTIYEHGDPSQISGYGRYFEKYTRDDKGNTVINPNWEESNEYNMMFLRAMEKQANRLLRTRKRLFLNEVYQMLGLPISKAGQVVGWVYDPENPNGDNFVSFGLLDEGPQMYSDFVYGNDPAIFLNFNVQGDVWSMMN